MFGEKEENEIRNKMNMKEEKKKKMKRTDVLNNIYEHKTEKLCVLVKRNRRAILVKGKHF